MFRRVWDVFDKYKAELVVSLSVVEKGNIDCFHVVKPQDKPRPLEGANAANKVNDAKSPK